MPVLGGAHDMPPRTARTSVKRPFFMGSARLAGLKGDQAEKGNKLTLLVRPNEYKGEMKNTVD